MLKQIRESNDITVREIAKKFGVDTSTIYYLEQRDNPPSIMLTMYLEHLGLPEETQQQIRDQRKGNWIYKEDTKAITNELKRIKNGLGRSAQDLSRLLGSYDTYWITLEKEGRQLTDDDLDILDIEFRLSSTTLLRHRIAVEKTKIGEPMDEHYQITNSEITEPYDLYDYQVEKHNSADYMKLIHELEDKYGESVENVPEAEPKLIELRECLGVIYYDA